MNNLGQWLGYLPLTVAIFGVVVLPGYLVTRAVGAARAIAVSLAPAVTFAVVGVAGIAAGAADVRWSWPVFLGATAVFVVVAAAFGRLRGMSHVNTEWVAREQAAKEQTRARRISLAMAAAFLILPILWLAAPNVPSSQADPMFHYNGVNAIANTGNASVLEAMGPNYGIRIVHNAYPAIWHAILALFGTGHIMPATHAFSYAVTPLISLASLDFFSRAALPRHTWAWIVAPVLSVILPYFPNFMSVSRGFWPNVVALAVLPAIYGLGILFVRSLPPGQVRGVFVPLGLLSLAGIGMGLAHPGAVFATLWPLVALAFLAIPFGLWRGIRHRSGRWLSVGTLASLMILVVAVLARHPRLQLFLDRPHPRSWNTAERLATLRGELANVPTALIVAAVTLGLVALVAIALAVRAAWRVPEARWIITAWFTQWLIVFGSYVDGNVFSTIAGIWYHDPKRAMAVQSLFTTMLVALLLDAWLRRSTRPAAAFGVIAAISLALGSVLRIGTVWADARPPVSPEHPIDSAAEIGLFESLESILPPGAVILGDPTTGLGYAPSYSRVNVVFPQVNYGGGDWDGRQLRSHFRDIHEDPHVCTILTEYGIGYYYEDDPLVYQKRDRSETWPGLYGVDTSRGFTKIAESDGGTLWRIDACGPIPESDWWDLSARTGFLPKN